ncbi:hypothetical protein [Faecalimonas umbilicata]|nr:hypothetical protein [Faecalimonas umbilicata]
MKTVDFSFVFAVRTVDEMLGNSNVEYGIRYGVVHDIGIDFVDI